MFPLTIRTRLARLHASLDQLGRQLRESIAEGTPGNSDTAYLSGLGSGDVSSFAGSYTFLYNVGFFNLANEFTWYYLPGYGLVQGS